MSATLAQATALAEDAQTIADVTELVDLKKRLDAQILHLQILTDELTSVTASRDSLQSQYDSARAALPNKFLTVLNSV